jgi:hypothetical protein
MRNPEKRRAQRLRAYGITVEQFESMLAKQGGGCAICGQANGPGRGERLHVDHCHSTGRVRGLLCLKCNHGIGNFSDDTSRMRAAIRYLDPPVGDLV